MARRIAPTEWEEQAAVIGFRNAMSGKYPALKMLYAVPNGGSRHPGEARRLKQSGVNSGVPDLCLPVARGGHGSLYIELKAGSGRPTPAQLWWRDRLNAEGQLAVVCWGAGTAIQLIMKYIAGEIRRGE